MLGHSGGFGQRFSFMKTQGSCGNSCCWPHFPFSTRIDCMIFTFSAFINYPSNNCTGWEKNSKMKLLPVLPTRMSTLYQSSSCFPYTGIVLTKLICLYLYFMFASFIIY